METVTQSERFSFMTVKFSLRFKAQQLTQNPRSDQDIDWNGSEA